MAYVYAKLFDGYISTVIRDFRFGGAELGFLGILIFFAVGDMFFYPASSASDVLFSRVGAWIIVSRNTRCVCFPSVLFRLNVLYCNGL